MVKGVKKMIVHDVLSKAFSMPVWVVVFIAFPYLFLDDEIWVTY